MRTLAFIDASNLFYGGEKSLGWKIDYQKLLQYLKEKYGASNAFYFGGVEIYDFAYDYQTSETVPIQELEKHLVRLFERKGEILNEAQLILVGRHLQRARFYLRLDTFGYELFLKPVKRKYSSLRAARERQEKFGSLPEVILGISYVSKNI